MMIYIRNLCYALLLLFLSETAACQAAPKSPIMGWSSWNHFRINIDEKMIKEQADAMIKSGMYDAGYRYINIDDGFFLGRDGTGTLLDNSNFSSGMKSLADYIHSRNLKAGIYSDAGRNTCGSIWDQDPYGKGVGLHGHIREDLRLYLKEWDFDFIKVDWCGGKEQGLNPEETYLEIIRNARAIKPEVVFNICNWEFPGAWAVRAADSWRIAGDI